MPIFVITVGDVIGFAFVALAGVVVLCLWAAQALREGRCKHDQGVSETRACAAICNKCGADLGFIGAWREKHPQ